MAQETEGRLRCGLSRVHIQKLRQKQMSQKDGFRQGRGREMEETREPTESGGREEQMKVKRMEKERPVGEE